MFDEEFFEVSDEDENILRYVRQIRRKDRVVRLRPNHFAIWDEKEFITRFRLSKETVHMIIQKIEDTIRSPTERYCCTIYYVN